MMLICMHEDDSDELIDRTVVVKRCWILDDSCHFMSYKVVNVSFVTDNTSD